MPSQPDLPATQEDRKAALDLLLLQHPDAYSWVDGTPEQHDVWRLAQRIPLGYEDGGPQVQAFARHRHAAQQAYARALQQPQPELVAYLATSYGPRCRDCADVPLEPVCEYTGLPCGSTGKAVAWVLRGLGYGLQHGYAALQQE